MFFSKEKLGISIEPLLSEMKINLENIDILLDNLLQWAVINPKKNNKKYLLLVMNKMINSKRGFYLDE